MRLAATIGFGLASALAFGCSSAPSNPTWTEDVAPIMAANCVKCHGRVARGGAPSTVRLDLFGGASFFAPFIVERTHQGTMPPVGPLSDLHVDTLRNWVENGTPFGDPVPGNEPPFISIEGFTGTGGTVTLPYVISDPDFDLVTGELGATPVGGGTEIIISRDLHSGAGEASWFIAAVAEGDYSISARLDDGNVGREFDLGRFRVPHEDGNTAPTLVVSSIFPDSILTPADSPFDVTFTINDPDNGQDSRNDAELAFVRGDERVVVASLANETAGDKTASIDLTTVPPGTWTFELTAGGATKTVDRVTVSDSTTSLTHANVEPIFNTYCEPCHSVAGIPGFMLTLDFSDAGIAAGLSGTTYRRVVLERSMPPRSAETLFDNFEPMPEADRAMLTEWLLGGAPP